MWDRHMPRFPYRLAALGTAGAASIAAPAAALAAEQASASGDVRIEQSVGASLEVSLLNEMLVQIYLPGSGGSPISLEPPGARRSGVLQPIGAAWPTATVSVNVQQVSTASNSAEGTRRKGLIAILAQFN
jgi:hypothetical protein